MTALGACSFKPYAVSVNENVLYSPDGNIGKPKFADTGLEACVNTYLNENPEFELETITILSCTEVGISSLIGLRQLPQLVQLDLSSNNISDLNPLIYLDKLRVLRIAENPIRDISIFLDMKSLRFVDLSGSERIPCSQLDQLKLRLGTSLRAPLSCRA